MPHRRRKRSTRRGLTLVELVVVVLLTAALLFALVGWTQAVRLQTRRELAVRLLAALNKSLELYRRSEGAYPPEAPDRGAADAMARLGSRADARSPLTTIPSVLWRESPRREFVDPWGTPLRYLGPAAAPARVRANGDRPVFVSAGVDRDFGEEQANALGDNIASDDIDVVDPQTMSASRPARRSGDEP